jgi:hypothetical protein
MHDRKGGSTNTQTRLKRIAKRTFWLSDKCNPDISGTGKAIKQRSETIFETATAKKIAGRSMHFPEIATSQAFETGRQANTKQHIRANDPPMIKAIMSRRKYRSQCFAATNRWKKIRCESLAKPTPVTNRHEAARRS